MSAGVVDINLIVKDGNASAVVAKIKQELRSMGNEGKQAGANISSGSHHAVSDLQATSAATRLLQGDLSRMMRTTELFLSKIPGLSGLLAKAFPVIGAVTFLYMLGNLAKGLVEFETEAKKVPQSINDSFRELNLNAESANDALTLTDEKLKEQIANFERKPANYLAEALAQATVNADDLAKAMGGVYSSVKAVMDNPANQVGFMGSVFSGFGRMKGGTSNVIGTVNSFNDQIADLTAHKADITRSGGNTDAIDKQIQDKIQAGRNTLTSMMGDFKASEKQGFFGSTFFGLGKESEDQTANIRITSAGLRGLDDDQSSISDRKSLDSDQEKANKLRMQQEAASKSREAATAAREAERAAIEKRLQVMQDGATKQELLYGKDIFNARQYWQQFRNAFSEGSKEWQTVNEKIVGDSPDLFTKAHSLRQKATESTLADRGEMSSEDELTARLATAQKKAAEDQLRDGPRYKQYNLTLASSDLQPEDQKNALDQTNLNLQEAAGSVSRYDAATRQATIHTNEWAVAREKLNAELRAVKSDTDMASQNPSEYATAVLEAQTRLAEGQGKYDLTHIADQADITQTTLVSTWDQSMALFVQHSKDTAAQIGDIFSSTLGSVNDSLSTALTAHYRTSRDRNLALRQSLSSDARNVASNLTKTGLQKAEGSILGSFGLGKPDGTSSNPLHVVMAGMGGVLGSGKGSLVSKATGGISGFLGGLFGGASKLLSATSGADPLSLNGSGGGLLSSSAGFGDMSFPGFADGGEPITNRPSIIGERGPEMFIPKVPGTVIPNHKLGVGGDTYHHTINVDARGSTDPGMVHSAIMRAAPQIIAATQARIKDDRRRSTSTQR
jgi:hypothetical protein